MGLAATELAGIKLRITEKGHTVTCSHLDIFFCYARYSMEEEQLLKEEEHYE